MMLAELYAESVRYSRETGYLIYNGSFWKEDPLKAQGKVHELTGEQLKEAEAELALAVKEMQESGAWDTMMSMSQKKAADALADDAGFIRYMRADAYRKFVLKRRDSKYVCDDTGLRPPGGGIGQKHLPEGQRQGCLLPRQV